MLHFKVSEVGPGRLVLHHGDSPMMMVITGAQDVEGGPQLGDEFIVTFRPVNHSPPDEPTPPDDPPPDRAAAADLADDSDADTVILPLPAPASQDDEPLDEKAAA